MRINNNQSKILAGVLYGFTAWALVQYFILPLIQSLITEKGFPPMGYAISFGIFGSVLGILLANATRHGPPRMRLL